MLIRIWLFGIASTYFSSALLTGDHICEVEERYPVNITEYSLKNVTVRNYKWCMGFPPRCSFYTLKAVKVPKVVERQQTQIVRKCCPGFVENANHDGCVPCRKCFEGTCGSGGNCLCHSGFRGEDCADACEPMRWGKNCQHECICEHGTCDPRTGRCDCPTGWFGTRCEVPCLEGFYGKHCINRCSCGERDLCNPETGECLKKPPRQQEHQSTRAIHYMTEDILNLTISMNKQRSTPSLKKYYTFDMELHSENNTDEDNEIITENSANKTLRNREMLKTTPPTGWTGGPTSTMDLSKKTDTTTSNGNKLMNADSSAESTTEMSAEIIPNVDIIDENGSLENHEHKSSNEKSQEIFEIEQINNTFDEENTLELQMNEKVMNMNKNSESPKNYENEPNTRKYDKSQLNHTTNSFGSSILKNISSTNPPTVDLKSSIEDSKRSKFDRNTKKIEVTTQIEKDIVPPTVFKPHFTTPPSKYYASSSNNAKNMEDNVLQNLDVTNNILTSRETTTMSSQISTTVGLTDIVKKAILPLADITPATKSIEVSNDLLTSNPTENQVFIKEAYGGEHNGKDGSEEIEYSANRSDITAHISVLAAVSFILVLILSGTIFAHHYIRRKKPKNKTIKMDNQIHAGHTVSVYTHSIFHTPLPDPPTFENPVFKTPCDNLTNEHGTFKTHVICSLNFPETKVDEKKEYTYDHPPSTGSYRAASIPEPPEIFEPPNAEPVYDEIPSTTRASQAVSPPPSYKSSCLYMNTCGRTKF